MVPGSNGSEMGRDKIPPPIKRKGNRGTAWVAIAFLVVLVLAIAVVLASGLIPLKASGSESKSDSNSDQPSDASSGIRSGDSVTYNVTARIGTIYTSYGNITCTYYNVTSSGADIKMDYWFVIRCDNIQYQSYNRAYQNTTYFSVKWNGSDGTSSEVSSNGPATISVQGGNTTVNHYVQDLRDVLEVANDTLAIYHTDWYEYPSTQVPCAMNYKMERATGGMLRMDLNVDRTTLSNISLTLGDRASNLQGMAMIMAAKVFWKNMDPMTGIYYDHGIWH